MTHSLLISSFVFFVSLELVHSIVSDFVSDIFSALEIFSRIFSMSFEG